MKFGVYNKQYLSKPNLSAQACVATICNCNIDKVIDIIGTKPPTWNKIKIALNIINPKLKIKTTNWYNVGDSIYKLLIVKLIKSNQSKYVIFNKLVMHDPEAWALGKKACNWEPKSMIVID